MKPVYEIKFLGSKDFDNLPKTETNGADISDSLGFYNPHTNRVFIRHTAIPELDKYLLEHEFDHLVEKDATDEDEFGIRHKKKGGFANLLRMFYNPLNIPGMGPLSNNDKGFLQTDNQSSTQGQNQSQNQMGSMMDMGGMSQNAFAMPSFGTPSPSMDSQQSNQGGLNQGLNSQSINPLADPYARYGQQSGRLTF